MFRFGRSEKMYQFMDNVILKMGKIVKKEMLISVSSVFLLIFFYGMYSFFT